MMPSKVLVVAADLRHPRPDPLSSRSHDSIASTEDGLPCPLFFSSSPDLLLRLSSHFLLHGASPGTTTGSFLPDVICPAQISLVHSGYLLARLPREVVKAGRCPNGPAEGAGGVREPLNRQTSASQTRRL